MQWAASEGNLVEEADKTAVIGNWWVGGKVRKGGLVVGCLHNVVNRFYVFLAEAEDVHSVGIHNSKLQVKKSDEE